MNATNEHAITQHATRDASALHTTAPVLNASQAAAAPARGASAQRPVRARWYGSGWSARHGSKVEETERRDVRR